MKSTFDITLLGARYFGPGDAGKVIGICDDGRLFLKFGADCDGSGEQQSPPTCADFKARYAAVRVPA